MAATMQVKVTYPVRFPGYAFPVPGPGPKPPPAIVVPSQALATENQTTKIKEDRWRSEN